MAEKMIVIEEETGERKAVMGQIKMICDRVTAEQSPEAWTMQVDSKTYKTIRSQLCVTPQFGVFKWVTEHYRINFDMNHYNGMVTLTFEPH